MNLATLKREASFASGLLRRKPFSCLIQVTNRCNMECSFCDFWPNAAPRKEELTLEEYRRQPATFGCTLVPRRAPGAPRSGCG